MLSGAASGSQRSFPGGHAVLLFSELVCSRGCCGPSDPRTSRRCTAEECCTVLFSAALQGSLCHGDVCVCVWGRGCPQGAAHRVPGLSGVPAQGLGKRLAPRLCPPCSKGAQPGGGGRLMHPAAWGTPFEANYTMQYGCHHCRIWVSSLQDSCNAENLYSHGEKLSLLGYMGRRGTTSLPTSLAPGKGQELSDRLQSLHSQPCSTCRAQGAAAERIW